MKLYTITNSINEIIAISEYKESIYRFFIQNNYNEYYKINIITKKKLINKYLIKYDDLYTEELSDYIVLQKDYKIICNIIENYILDIKLTINDLKSSIDKLNLSIEEEKYIYTTINILKKKVKKKNIIESIDLRKIIYEYYNIDLYKNLKLLYEEYNNIINNK